MDLFDGSVRRKRRPIDLRGKNEPLPSASEICQRVEHQKNLRLQQKFEEQCIIMMQAAIRGFAAERRFSLDCCARYRAEAQPPLESNLYLLLLLYIFAKDASLSLPVEMMLQCSEDRRISLLLPRVFSISSTPDSLLLFRGPICEALRDPRVSVPAVEKILLKFPLDVSLSFADSHCNGPLSDAFLLALRDALLENVPALRGFLASRSNLISGPELLRCLLLDGTGNLLLAGCLEHLHLSPLLTRYCHRTSILKFLANQSDSLIPAVLFTSMLEPLADQNIDWAYLGEIQKILLNQLHRPASQQAGRGKLTFLMRYQSLFLPPDTLASVMHAIDVAASLVSIETEVGMESIFRFLQSDFSLADLRQHNSSTVLLSLLAVLVCTCEDKSRIFQAISAGISVLIAQKVRVSIHALEGHLLASLLTWIERENCYSEFIGLQGTFRLQSVSYLFASVAESDFFQFPIFCSFDQKLKLLKRYLDRKTDQYFVQSIEQPVIEIRRGHEFEDAFLKSNGTLKIPYQPFVFEGETSAGQGVTLEGLLLCIRQAMSTSFGMFFEGEDRQLHLSADPGFGMAFEFLGSLISSLLLIGRSIDFSLLPFSFSFLSAWRRGGTDRSDIQFLDPVFYQSLCRLFSISNISELELSFSAETAEGSVDLVAGGRNIPVTSGNRKAFVVLASERKIRNRNVGCFLRGLYRHFDRNFISLFNEAELLILFSGYRKSIDLNAWRVATVYRCTNESRLPRLMEIFWGAVSRLSFDQQSALLMFATASARPPLAGFAALSPKFLVSFSALLPPETLPTSHTCFNAIYVPFYASVDQCFSKLVLAVESVNSGFK